MPSSPYHEAVWESLPGDLEPSDWQARLRFLLDHVRSGQRVLDLGCGEGRFAAELQRAGAEVLAVDVAEEPLRRARSAHPALELSLIAADGGWDLPDAGFDVVWAGEVIEHVTDTAGWLSEVRRVLRPGGSLLLSTPAHPPLRRLALALLPGAWERHLDPRGDHLRFYTRRSLRELLDDFRFEQLQIASLGPPLVPRVLLAAAVRSRF
ncbi:MAG TPA: class I SAM-dependent methyltransferase [Solirubrobacteraceae bacterium]|nr:class I SAM-dependent methyltransferase [Solirubrobacteraceae bacterium]